MRARDIATAYHTFWDRLSDKTCVVELPHNVISVVTQNPPGLPREHRLFAPVAVARAAHYDERTDTLYVRKDKP